MIEHSSALVGQRQSFARIDQSDNVRHIQNFIGEASRDGGRRLKRLMLAHPVVPAEGQRQRMTVVFPFSC